ncbi:MAG: hypothetical protein U1B30_11990 [Pseudomonadota bacterium]|nr:hypothetical protein [Pseudomonadota bacterium]
MTEMVSGAKIVFLSAMWCICCSVYAEDEECINLLNHEKEYHKEIPIKIDSTMTLVAMKVDCATKTVTFVKQLNITLYQLQTGYQHRRQQKHLNVHCHNEGLPTVGWSAIEYVYEKNMQLLVRLEANPELCAHLLK